METNKRRRANTVLLQIFAALLILGISFGAVDLTVLQAHAADNNDYSYTVPQDATQVWIDVESSEAADSGLQGTFAKKDLKFKASPSGTTAIAQALNLSGEDATLTLRSDSSLNALVAVTFADDNDVIITEYASETKISTEPVVVVPGNPVQPAGTKSSSAAKKTGIIAKLQQTGVAVRTMLLLAAVLVAVSIALFAIRGFHKGVHQGNRQGGAR